MKRSKGPKGVRVTPSMRRKVDDLAVWLAEGDRAKLKDARKTIVDLLCTAAGMTDERSRSRLPKRR